MKTVQKNITSLLAASVLAGSIFTSVAYAVEDGKKHKRGPNIERIAEKLELSSEETVSFTEVMKLQIEKKKAISTALREERKSKMDAHREDTLTALAAVLTEEQLNTMQEMMDRKKNRKKKRGDKHDHS